MLSRRPEPGRGRRNGSSTVVRRSMLSFVVGSLVTLLVVGVASVWVARDVALRAAMREAALRGSAFSHSVVAPLIAKGMINGRVIPGGQLSAVLIGRLEDKSIAHIKLWDSTGRVVWADEHTLVGKRFTLEPDVVRLFGNEGMVGDVTHLDKPENALEASADPLLEVYAGALPLHGPPLVVETYWSMERLDAAQWALLRDLVPLVLGALLLFQVVVFPLALSLARRVDRGLVEREVMVHHALSASELERDRIAAQLHDGVIQDLAGIGFALPSIAAGLESAAHSSRQLLGETHRLLLKDVEQLRTMLAELHPADLADGRLAEAVESLARNAERAGVRTSVQVDDTTGQSPAVIRMAYRIAREGVQNVLKHAQASTMQVTAGPDGPDYVVRVVDDGRGTDWDHESHDGHMGLQLLGATLTDVGGALSVTRGATGGTVLKARFPASLTEISNQPMTGTGRNRSISTRLLRKVQGR